MRLLACSLLAILLLPASSAQLRDVGRFEGWKENYLSGVGLVTGLSRTGDSGRSKATRQAISNLLARFNLSVTEQQIVSRNTATVAISATLPALSRPGDKVDVVVTSLGDAKSLTGGALLLTPLQGPNGRVYCLAQGSINVGGLKIESNDSSEQLGHPTVGIIAGGCTVEVGTTALSLPKDGRLRYLLNRPDYVMANHVAVQIRGAIPAVEPVVKDAGMVEILFPTTLSDQQIIELIGSIDAVHVDPVSQVTVVVNERSGVIVAGADATIAPITISQSGLRISITSVSIIAQPLIVVGSDAGIVEHESQIKTQDGPEVTFVHRGTSVAGLVEELSRQKVSVRDMIAILQAIKAAGALYADIVVQ